MSNTPFTLSIEATHGKSKQYGFHFGTDERLARQLIEEKAKAWIANDMPFVSMALMRNGKIVDVIYSDMTWHNAAR